MAYAINCKFISPFHAVAWQFHTTLADKTADTINPSVDLGSAQFWLLLNKFRLKASNNTVAVKIETADVLAGTGNVQEIAEGSFASSVLGSRILVGWTDRSQQFMNVNVTLGGTATYDVDVYGSPVS